MAERFDRIWHNARLATVRGDLPELGVIERGVIAARDSRIVFAGARSDFPSGADAAARTRDLFVACSLQPQLELVCTVSTENQVGMTIHQSGRDPPRRAIDPFGRIGIRWKVGTAACKDDAAIARRDHAEFG